MRSRFPAMLLSIALALSLLEACGPARSATPTTAPSASAPTRGLPATPGLVPTPTSTGASSPVTTTRPAPTVASTAASSPLPSPAPSVTETPSETPAGLTFLDISPAAQTFPAGACVSFYARTDPATEPLSYRYWVERMPPGLTAYFQGSPAPYQNTLVADTAGMTAPGSYVVRVGASRGETAPVFADIALNITSCSGFSTGVYAESIQSNLVALFTAGKPAIEHGLLVPLQVCASDRARRLKVALESAISEAGTPMTTPPRFYIFRSLVWPAPANIQTHNWGVNAIKAADATGWQLELEISPGLWLLVFEHDRYGPAPDPGEIPAIVMYRLEIVP